MGTARHPVSDDMKRNHQVRPNSRQWTWRAFLPTIAVLYLSLKSRVPWLPGWSCPIRHLTGVPCPGCFLTRSVALSLSGRLGSALEWHVLGPPAAAALVFWSISSLRAGTIVRPRGFSRWLMVFSVAAVMVWGLRLLLQYRFGVQAFPAV